MGAFVLLICSSIAQANWYQFRPCGFAGDTVEELGNEFEPSYQPSPRMMAIFWWIPETSVVHIVELKAEKGELNCSWLSVNGDSWLIVGTAGEIKSYIARVSEQR